MCLAGGGELLGPTGKSGAQDSQPAYVVGHGRWSHTNSPGRYDGAHSHTAPDVTAAVGKLSHALLQYLRQLDGIDDMVHPPESSHLCNRLINKNGLRHFRKQF